MGFHSLLDLTKRFTTRTDDSHAIPLNFKKKINFGVVRFYADYQIKTHAPPFV